MTTVFNITQANALALVNEKVPLDAVFVNGQWQSIASEVGQTHDIIAPATGEWVATTSLATKAQVEDAVQSAHRALWQWSNTTPTQRAGFLYGIADAMQAIHSQLVSLIVLGGGKPILEAQLDVDDAIACYRFYAKVAASLVTQKTVYTNYDDVKLQRIDEPVGVCALIVPWNFPLVTTAWKLAPALAAGCTVVLKPSELALLPELMLGDVLSQAGVPDGVVNIVPGGADVGEAMTTHALVDKVSFTGSNLVGEKVMVQAAKTVKDISLELGGKSAIIVREDADLDLACDLVTTGIFANAGQICSATSRLLVHESIASALYAKLKTHCDGLIVGNGFDDNVQMGALISQNQRDRVANFFAIAEQEGLTCLTGGKMLKQKGHFVQPTIYTDVPTDSRLWQEEIFGPVLVTRTFADDAEAIALANDSQYGLAASIIGTDDDAMRKIAKQLRVGHIWINTHQVVLPESGWGGFKHSGIGRELGKDGLSAYLASKHLVLPKTSHKASQKI